MKEERRFRAKLQEEYDSRREKNPRYSLRAFAAFLATDHSTLSQILQGVRKPPVTRIRSWAERLGMDREETVAYIACEHVPDAQTAQRAAQLRHWTAEAMNIVGERAHWEILRLCRNPGFRPDCRSIAETISVPVDEVNMALSRLLRLRLLEVSPQGEWIDLTGLPNLTEKAFREIALARVRNKAAEFSIKLPALGKKK